MSLGGVAPTAGSCGHSRSHRRGRRRHQQRPGPRRFTRADNYSDACPCCGAGRCGCGTVAENRQADVHPRVLTDALTYTDQMSPEAALHVTETVEAEEVSTEPTTVDTREPSAKDSSFESANADGRPETPRPAVCDSFDASAQPRELSDRGDDDGSTTPAVVADDETATAKSSRPQHHQPTRPLQAATLRTTAHRTETPADPKELS